MDKRLLKDLPYFVDFKHGNIEVYHSFATTQYCPKRLHFSHHGMSARSQIAVLRFNSIVNAEQDCIQDETPRFKLQFSKVSQCYVVKPVQEVSEKAYLEDLISEIIKLAKLGGHSGLPCIPEREPNLEKHSKEEVVQFQKTRFSVNSSHKSSIVEQAFGRHEVNILSSNICIRRDKVSAKMHAEI